MLAIPESGRGSLITLQEKSQCRSSLKHLVGVVCGQGTMRFFVIGLQKNGITWLGAITATGFAFRCALRTMIDNKGL
jgi:hypothetical protein